jgi:uncharacterized membrane protein (UPF0127 family)
VQVKTKLIVNSTQGAALCVGELADSPLLRMRGLLGRTGLPAGEGMLITPAPSIHTAFMRFPIDALFLDREFRVIKIVEQLEPWRVASMRRARAVLELAAGESARQGVRVGDVLELRERTRARERRAASAMGNSPRQNGQASAATSNTPAAESLTRLAPLRVLLMSSDRHYRTAMSLLLGRHNCSVSAPASARGTVEQLERERFDVVVVDRSAKSALELVATVRSLTPPVGLVVVDEADQRSQDGLIACPKWGPIDELMEAIDRARTRARSEQSGEQP